MHCGYIFNLIFYVVMKNGKYNHMGSFLHIWSPFGLEDKAP